MRGHVLKNLLDTEKSYVQNLQFLVSVSLHLILLNNFIRLQFVMEMVVITQI